MVNKDVLLVVVTALDDDDFSSLFDNIQHKDDILLVTDKTSIENVKNISLDYIEDDFSDMNLLIKKIAQWKASNEANFIGIIGLDEEYHYSIAKRISSEFSLAYYSQETLDLVSNKYLQRAALKKASVAVPSFEIITGDGNISTSIAYPNVLKLMTGFASSYIYVNDDEKSFKLNIEEIKKVELDDSSDPMLKEHEVSSTGEIFDPKKQFLVEEFIGGIEFSCDYVVEDGSVRVLRVVRKFVSEDFYPFFEGFLLFNPDDFKSSLFSISDLTEVCKNTASALGIQMGVCMMDFKFFKNKIYVIETTVRPGISSFVDLMSHLYGYISIDCLVAQKFSEKLSNSIPSSIGLVVYLTTTETGIVKSIDTSKIESNYKDNGLIRIFKYYAEGEKMLPIPKGINRPGRLVGHVLIGNVSEDKITEVFDDIKKSFRVIVE